MFLSVRALKGVCLCHCAHIQCVGLKGRDYKPIRCTMFCMHHMDRLIKSFLRSSDSPRCTGSRDYFSAFVAGVTSEVATLSLFLFIPAGWNQLKNVKQSFLSLMESSLKHLQAFQVRMLYDYKCNCIVKK